MADQHSTEITITATPKARLTRGIDPIPPHWESASSWASIKGLIRTVTTLERLAEAAETLGDKASARDLRRCRTATQRALDGITGGFERAYIEPLADQWARAKEMAHG